MAQAVRRETPSPLTQEGFLCPMCLLDLGSADALATHFDSTHNSQGSSPDVIDQMKGLYVN